MPRHVQEIFIRTSPEQLWRALTDPELTSRYHFAGGLQAGTAPGEAYEYSAPGGAIRVEGTIEESDPPRRLVMSFRLAGPAAEDAGAADERPSRAWPGRSRRSARSAG